jgi:hypothetical protein
MPHRSQGRPCSIDRGMCRRAIEPRNAAGPRCRRCSRRRKATCCTSPRQEGREPRAVDEPRHAQTPLTREPGGPVSARPPWHDGSRREVSGRQPTMNGHGKSDRRVLPTKPPNNDADSPPVAGQRSAEVVEGRRLAKGNPPQHTLRRTQRRVGRPHELERIRQAASRNRKMRFTALVHHVYRPATLRRAAFGVNPKAAPGVAGVTWQQYGEDLDHNLEDLSRRWKRGAYRAQPPRRTSIPQADGRQRPLGVTALEDQIAQAALVEGLNAI